MTEASPSETPSAPAAPALSTRMLQGIHCAFTDDTPHKTRAVAQLSNDKLRRCIVDAFHMKAIWMMEAHLKKSMGEIVALIKQGGQGGPEIVDESDRITVRQLIDVGKGSMVTVSGSFKRPSSSAPATLPIVESFRLIHER